MKSVTVLKLKVEPCPEFDEVGKLCREARNVAAEDWLLRQRGRRNRPKQKGKCEATKMYHAITAAVSTLGTDVAASIGKQVNSFLSAKVDWKRRDDKCSRRRDAILAREARPPYYIDLSIPVANKYTTIRFEDSVLVTVSNVTRENGGQKSLAFQVSLKGVPQGIKDILHELASGERKLADSKLIKRDGTKRKGWYWYVPVAFDKPALDSDKEATLMPVIRQSQFERPYAFALDIPGRQRLWGVLDGRYLWAQSARLGALKKYVGWRYRQRQETGHGRGKIETKLRMRDEQLNNVRAEVRRKAIVDVIRQCERAQVGTVVFREPTDPVKKFCWFEWNGLTFDWTRWRQDLKNACARRGITVKSKKLKYNEINETTECRNDSVEGENNV